MLSKEQALHFTQSLEHLKEELNSIRTNRATPALVEKIPVSVYGTQTPLVQLASITTPDARTLVIQPWDKSTISEIEKALQQSGIGIQPTVTGDVIRLVMPPLTEERRKEMVKVVHQKGEDARIHIRGIRERILKEWKERQKAGDMSEDSMKLDQKKLQEKIDGYNDQIKNIIEHKEKDVLSV